MANQFGQMGPADMNAMLMLQQQQQRQNMALQQQQQQNMQAQQFAQPSSQMPAALNANIMAALQAHSNQIGPHDNTWRAAVSLQERLNNVLMIMTAFRLINMNDRAAPKNALECEKAAFESSNDKDHYTRQIQERQGQLQIARVANQSSLQAQIHAQTQQHQQQSQLQAANTQAQQLTFPGQPGMPNQMQRVPIGQQGQPVQPNMHLNPQLQLLQRPMQAASAPGQQQASQLGLNPANVVAQQQQQQQSLGQNMQGMNPNNPQMQLAMQQRAMQAAQQHQVQQAQQQQIQSSISLTADDMARATEIAMQQAQRMSEEVKASFRARGMASLPPEQRLSVQQNGQDPLIPLLRSQVLQSMRKSKQDGIMAQMQRMGNVGMQRQQPPPQAMPMQQQRSQNPTMDMNQISQQVPGAGQDFTQFLSNVENVVGLQQQGVMAQESGQMVVPANNAGLQPMSMNGLRAAPGAMPQGGLSQQQQLQNQNALAQQMRMRLQAQQAQNAHQAQAQAQAQQAQQAQAQAQAQARNAQAQAQAQATAKAAQHIAGLQGQPGGLGPMPAQQSPAMNTLNTPIRTPQQQAKQPAPPGTATPNPSQFVQPGDPRFAAPKAQNKATTTGSSNDLMFPTTMPEEMRNRLQDSIPKERLAQVLEDWQPGAQGNISQSHRQGQPGSDFMTPAQPQMTPNGISGAANMQQQLQLQQRLALQRAQSQQGGPPATATGQPSANVSASMFQAAQRPALTQQERVSISKFDGMPVPAPLLQQAQVRLYVTQNCKTWGDLKHAIGTSNQPAATSMYETLLKLQYSQAQAWMRDRMAQSQAAQGGNGAQAGMTQAQAMQRQAMMAGHAGARPSGNLVVSPADVASARATGQYNNMTDDAIRAALLQSMMGSNRQQTNATGVGTNFMQSSQGAPMLQSGLQKSATQQSPPPKQTAAGKTTQQTLKQSVSQKQAASKGQPSPPVGKQKNLKRQSSDDVVEISNPKEQSKPSQQQQQRPASAKTSAQPNKTTQTAGNLQPDAEQLQRQQSGSGTQPADLAAAMTTIKIIYEQELQRVGVLPIIEMTAEEKLALKPRLARAMQTLTRVKPMLVKLFAETKDEEMLRKFWLHWSKCVQQFTFGDNQQIIGLKDSFSIKAADADEGYNIAQAVGREAIRRFPNPLQRPSATTPQAEAAKPMPTPPVVPQNTSKTQQKVPVEKKGHQRSASRNDVPPAPTSSHPPPFPKLENKPQATPVYYNEKPALTQDHLKLPANKRQKQNTAVSTPAVGQQANAKAAKVAPGVTTQSSGTVPVAASQQQAPLPTKFFCSEEDCEYAYQAGFDNADDLEQHRIKDHYPARANPAEFLLMELDSMLESKSNETASANTTDIKGVAHSRVPSISQKRKSMPGDDVGESGQSTELAASGNDTPRTNSFVLPPEVRDSLSVLHTVENSINDILAPRSQSPEDTPTSADSAASEPNSDISDGLNLNIELTGLLEDDWYPFGVGVGSMSGRPVEPKVVGATDGDADLFLDFSMYDTDFDGASSSTERADVGKLAVSEAPFTMDTSLFSFSET